MAAVQTLVKKRFVFLNALPLNAFDGMHRMMLDVAHVDDTEAMARWIRERVESGYEVASYIRHVSTVEALKKMGFPVGQPNAGVYKYMPGDVLIVVVLKSPVRNGSEVAVKEDDLDIWVVNVVA